MKKPVVDYRTFRLRKRNDPEFSHLKLLLSWVGYFALYFLTENFIPAERCYPVHCRLDDLIPFNEFFLIFYVSWYVLIVVSLVYFLLYDVESFKSMQTYIIITQVVAMTIYILLPSRQDLRPETFSRDNFLTRLMAFIYTVDTNTGVCPSLHVAYSLGIASTWLKKKDASRAVKVFITVLAFFICISVAFVKQHSVVDIFAAIPVGILAEFLVFRKYWRKRLAGTV